MCPFFGSKNLEAYLPITAQLESQSFLLWPPVIDSLGLEPSVSLCGVLLDMLACGIASFQIGFVQLSLGHVYFILSCYLAHDLVLGPCCLEY